MDSFAKQLADFQVKVEGRTHEIVRQTVLDLGARIIDLTPIKSGRAKSNLFYGLEVRNTRTTDETGIRTINDIGDLPTEAAGFNHYLTNSLRYGPSLERGSSTQAPQGMFGIAAIEAPGIVESIARRLNT